MFSWIPIHAETAKRLLEFKDRNHELVAILVRMHEAGLKASVLNDRGSDGSTFTLKETDPFTFLANFNRSVTDDNRRALWKALKDEWQLQSEVPADFDGLPLANPQAAWLMPHARKRTPEHVPLLWEFFEHIMAATPETLDTALMQKCLDLNQVGFATLTMGMFWACPRTWISGDSKNLEFSKSKGVEPPPKTAEGYATWLPKMRDLVGGDIVKFSREAHLWASAHEKPRFGPPFDKLFPDHKPDRVLDFFARVISVLREESNNPGDLLSITLRKRSGGTAQIRVNIWWWAVATLSVKPGRRRIEFIVPYDHPESVRYRNAEKAAGREEPKAFSQSILGVSYGLPDLDELEFFDRFEEIWPDIEKSLEALSQYCSGKQSPWLANHRHELEVLCIEPDRRTELLEAGLSFQGRSDLKPTKNRRYWLIAPGEGARKWDQWTETNLAALGWDEIGDFNAFATKAEIQQALEAAYPGDRSKVQAAYMVWSFSKVMKTGDVVFAKLGKSEVIGWGVVDGPLSFNPELEEYQNVVPVIWEEAKAIRYPERNRLPTKTVTDITGDRELIEFLAKSYPGVPGLEEVEGDYVEPVIELLQDALPYGIEDALAELFMTRESLEHILEQLRRKKNIILQGAPGVGKTFIAKRLAWLHLGAKDKEAVEMVQFHQSYTYEDFVQGLRPTKDGHFDVRDGSFYRLCRKALANPRQDYFLVIDEINRGNLSKILGELMMLIETDKRGQEMTLAYSEEPFTVPANLYLIGTMNTADRSLSLVDCALRRRFAFLTLDPGFETDTFVAHLGRHGLTPAQINHIRWQMATLNDEIARDEANLGAGYRIGHSFFTPTAPVSDFRKWFLSIVRYEILPLLEEYWIDDPKKLQQFRLSLVEGIP